MRGNVSGFLMTQGGATITLKGSDGKENKVTVATKDTRNTVKAGENVTLDTAPVSYTHLRHTPAEFFYIFRRADEVSVGVREQSVMAVGDNHLMITENHGGKDFIRQFQIFERYMDIRRLVLYLSLIHILSMMCRRKKWRPAPMSW